MSAVISVGSDATNTGVQTALPVARSKRVRATF